MRLAGVEVVLDIHSHCLFDPGEHCALVPPTSLARIANVIVGVKAQMRYQAETEHAKSRSHVAFRQALCYNPRVSISTVVHIHHDTANCDTDRGLRTLDRCER